MISIPFESSIPGIGLLKEILIFITGSICQEPDYEDPRIKKNEEQATEEPPTQNKLPSKKEEGQTTPTDVPSHAWKKLRG